ncbi:MAG: Wzz/FepE/Etk N-terminal domain-containing protein [Tissierellia bacterium]|nr:Wzz/FepE/Etk N-terminal domain-containing protein [Tissierellia bacterium]
MEKITVAELLSSIKKSIIKILVFSIVFALLVFCAFKFLKKPSYEAKSQLIVTESEDSINYNDMMLNEKLIGTYEAIITSADVCQKTIEDLGIDMKIEELKSKIKVESNAQSGVISLSISDKNKDKAVDLLTSVCENFRKKTLDLISVDNVEYLDKPQVTSQPKDKSKLMGLIAFVFAFIISIFFVLVEDILVAKIKNREYLLENGYEILGEVHE